MTHILKRTLSIILSLILIFSIFSVIPVSVSAAEVTDTINLSFTGVSGTSYGEWNDKQGTSGAVYAGQSAGDKDSVQLRSKNSNSGIIVTSSIGKVKKITVTWNDGTPAGNKLDIYGKNTKYDSPSDLYGSKLNQSTSLGSIVKGTSTELNVSGDYTFIGMRSNSGAIYLTNINITWEQGAASTYTVTWKNGEQILETDTNVEKDSKPSFDSTIPEKNPDVYGTYTFDGWQSSVDDQVYKSNNLPNVTADVTYTAHFALTPYNYSVIWKNYDYSVLETDQSVQAGSHPEYNGETPSKPENEEYTYVFTGWKSSTNDVIYTSADFGNIEILADTVFTAQFKEKSKTEVTDVINRTLTGISGTSYSNWSGKTSNSDAVYAGNSAGGNDAVQIRTDKSNSGVVSTKSGGTAVKVVVSWNSNTSNGRTIDIYGKNTAYSSASDLYNSSKQGTKIGSIQYDKTTVTGEINIEGEYEYIGIRSNSGALYADSISITWAPASSKPVYNITWNYHGESKTNTCIEGNTPSFGEDNPSAYDEGNIRHYFTGWTPEPAPVYSDTTYEAAYNSISLYTVKWNNYDDSELSSGIYEENDTPAYSGDTPVRQEDDQFTYTFSGWSPEITAVTKDTIYTAQFTPVSKSRKTDELTREDTGITGSSYGTWSGVVKKSNAVYAGNTAGGNSSIQMRSSDNSGIITTTSGGRVKEITVEWHSSTDNSRVLQIYGKNSAYGSAADLYGNNKGKLIGTIARNGQTTATISGNYGYIGLRSESGAMYIKSISIVWEPGNSFDITWDRNNSQDLITEEVESGNSPAFDYNTYGTPEKPADAQYTYLFKGWKNGNNTYGVDDTLPAANDNVTYTAVYEETLRSYTVTWKNYNGDVLNTLENIIYGTNVHYEGDEPKKPSDGTYTYTFAGWNPPQGEITGDTVYTAQFSAEPIPYVTVTWKNGDTVLKTDTKVTPSTVPVYSGGTPEKAEDDFYTYTFYGWKTEGSDLTRYMWNALPAVSDNTVFVAVYSAKPKYHSGRIFDTSSVKDYDLGGKYYCINEGAEAKQFTGKVSFNDTITGSNEGSLSIGGEEITVTPPAGSVFAHSVYVKGNGTDDDPYIFYPNYLYGQNVEKVADAEATDKSSIHPGDGFNGMSKIRIGYDYVRFLQYVDLPDLECQHGTNGFMGISISRYGNRYGNETAEPYPFVMNGNTIYYMGELNSAHTFTEERLFDDVFGNVTPQYTVTWNNWDDTELRSNLVYQGLRPSYGNIEDAVPKRPEDNDYTYEFSGWSDGTTEYAANEELPIVTEDITYSAIYTPTSIPKFTVTWRNWDNEVLETDENVKINTNPSYDGNKPSRESDDTYIYFFEGWKDNNDNEYSADELPKVTDDVTYTAILNQYTKAGYEPIENIEWVFKTDEPVAYDLSHMFYTYNGSDPLPFDGLSTFKRVGDTLTLGGKTVADIGVEILIKDKKDVWKAEFTNSVYVTGTGSYYNPFVFHPNYLFYGTQHNINQGFHVTLKEEYKPSQNINNLSYPGDSYKGRAEIAVSASEYEKQYVHFITQNITEVPDKSHWYVGVGLDTFGVDYDDDTANHEFSKPEKTLYYYGEVNEVFQFDEKAPTYQNSFGRPESYTITFENDNGDEISSKEYYYGEIPAFEGDEPQKSSEPIRYNFTGWTDGTSTFAPGEEFPAVTGPEGITYTACYEQKEFFAGHSLTLEGDIGIFFFIDVNAAGITPDDIKTGKNEINFTFSWETKPAPYSTPSDYNITLNKDNYSQLYVSSMGYFKIRCNVAVAEMSALVKITANVKDNSNKSIYSDTENYSVRDYAMTIINNSNDYKEKLVHLVKTMLDYGAKAQMRFDILKNDLANKEVSDYTMQDVTVDMIKDALTNANPGKEKSDMKENTESFGLEYDTITIVYLTKSTLRFYYTISDQGLYDSCKNNSTFTLNESKLPYVIFEKSNIPAKDLDMRQEFTINNNTYYYSALDFAVDLLSSSNPNIYSADLAKSMFWYNQAANDYFKN